MKTKSGFVTIVGKPNVGKSTLMNKLLREDLSIVTNKPQTTRKRVLGILSEDDYQIIFLDTPGILDPKYLMQEKLSEFIKSSVKDSNIIIFMITLKKFEGKSELLDDNKFLSMIAMKNKKKILVINKIDLLKQEPLNRVIEYFNESKLFDAIIPISALEDYNIDNLIQTIVEFLPFHPKYYPDDQLADEHLKDFLFQKK